MSHSHSGVDVFFFCDFFFKKIYSIYNQNSVGARHYVLSKISEGAAPMANAGLGGLQQKYCPRVLTL